jgi:hypothetical protein
MYRNSNPGKSSKLMKLPQSLGIGLNKISPRGTCVNKHEDLTDYLDKYAFLAQTRTGTTRTPVR